MTKIDTTNGRIVTSRTQENCEKDPIILARAILYDTMGGGLNALFN